VFGNAKIAIIARGDAVLHLAKAGFSILLSTCKCFNSRLILYYDTRVDLRESKLRWLVCRDW